MMAPELIPIDFTHKRLMYELEQKEHVEVAGAFYLPARVRSPVETLILPGKHRDKYERRQVGDLKADHHPELTHPWQCWANFH